MRRYLSYWWSALIVPDRKWSDAHNANAFMSQGILDHLGAAADIIAVHLGGSASAPSGEGIAELKDQCEKLLELVQGIDGEHLPSHARREIIGQIQHLLWLIANVALFGEAPVSREASIVIGSLVQTSSQVARNNASVAGRWKKVVMAFVAAAAVFSAGTTAAQEAIDSGLGLAGEIASVVGGELDVSSD
ncbi:hypothetical protein [Streptomyces sp. NPDC050560]|uniref:hypothetical protein n=1 Tax=Streptomyces sp. NPDC050560 TaxID=3365630 RepID=UPI0037ABF510